MLGIPIDRYWMSDNFEFVMNWHNTNRREFIQKLSLAGIALSLGPGIRLAGQNTDGSPRLVISFPGPWSFDIPKGSLILVSDQQLEDLQDPDKEVDVSLTATPNRITFRHICEQSKAMGAKTLILAFDQFWAQYRKGQGDKPRQLMPDTDAYIQRIQRLSETLKKYGLGLELSLLSPLELGNSFEKKTGEQGRWVQYREGLRDPKTGRFEVALWEHKRWTNNKGSIDVQRQGIKVFAFSESRVGDSPFYHVNPAEIVELTEVPETEVWEGARADAGTSFSASRLIVRGKGGPLEKNLNRVLVVVSYKTPEMDYFSPKALPFLKDLVDRYHQAGIPLNGLYSDEMHIQQDWVYHAHHDVGQFTFRYLTPNLARVYAEKYGAEFASLEKYLVYFCYGQHEFDPSLEERLASQHVLGTEPVAVQKTFLLRRRYYQLLHSTVVDLFTQAREYAEKQYGHDLEARAHATWAQSPTIDQWDTPGIHHPTKQYEYTPDFVWSNTVHQAAAACDDYFKWNDFLTGGGNDHAEGGWSDRNYYALALACSTGILNRVPYAYAAHWGMPAPIAQRRQGLVDAYGASATAVFKAVEESQHRDIEVLMLYPISLVSCEERFGSWMTQYGYANYVTAEQLLLRAKVNANGSIEMAGRTFTTLVALFEPLPPAGLIDFIEDYTRKGGRMIWSGPPPCLDMGGADILERWLKLFGIQQLDFGVQGLALPGTKIEFANELKPVAAQTILTHFLVDHVYPVVPEKESSVVARINKRNVGVLKGYPQNGQAVFLGFRPRDDQSASLGYESRTWFDILKTLGAYPGSAADKKDNPSVVSRDLPFLACHFPNGAITIGTHYRTHEESWPGGFHRDAKEDDAILVKNPPFLEKLNLENLEVNGYAVTYKGRLLVGFRVDKENRLIAFAGYNSQTITINGKTTQFSSKPMSHIGWAPVPESRRVPGGAILEIWCIGDGEISIPLGGQAKQPKLFFSAAIPGAIGEEVPTRIEQDQLRFESKQSWPRKHLYLIG